MNEKTQENIKTEDSKLLYEKLAEGISSTYEERKTKWQQSF